MTNNEKILSEINMRLIFEIAHEHFNQIKIMNFMLSNNQLEMEKIDDNNKSNYDKKIWNFI